MTTPAENLERVDAALAQHAVHIGIARRSGRPYAVRVHMPIVDALLELRSELQAEMGQEAHTTPPRTPETPRVAPTPTRGLYGGSGGAQ